MNGSSIFRALAVVLLVVVAIGVGVGLYNAGLAAGMNQVVVQPVEGQPVPVVTYPYAPYGHGWGFGFFGIIFWILGFFLIFALIRAAFGWGRGGGWGSHRSGGWYGGGRNEAIADFHRELHRRESATDEGDTADRTRTT